MTTRSAADDLVIQTLAAELRAAEHERDVTRADCEAYRAAYLAAVRLLHDAHTDRERLRERVIMARESRRAAA